ncbi:MAG: hypothetical protein ACOX17_02775 [Christensenellales bacterium]|jgi:hypothetical protein
MTGRAAPRQAYDIEHISGAAGGSMKRSGRTMTENAGLLSGERHGVRRVRPVPEEE